MKISVIIVTYNTKLITKNCIDSVFQQTQNLDFEVILVDNNSTDGSKELFESYPKLKYIYLNENIGFGQANNKGAKIAEGEFLFLLNSDTILIENSILKFYDFFTNNEKVLKIGVLGCVLVGQDLEVNGFGGQFPTCEQEKLKLWNVLPIISNFVSTPKLKNYAFENDYFEIDYVIGADMFLRKQLFDKMNGFHEAFFMYFEETDLQKRIFDSGLKQYILTSTKIIHLEEASGKSIQNYSNRKKIITNKSKLNYLKRNDSVNFKKYIYTDFFFVLLNFLNFKYSFKENLTYLKEIKKIY